LNFIDRTLIAVVAQPIIESFELTDFQWSLVYGLPFALFYAAMGLPIAMWADRANRVKIISLCIVVWSLATALCGIATGFFLLVSFRIGVAIGEAGGTPPANSIIGDYFKPVSRSTALGIYSMGVTLGSVLANLFGGPIAAMQGADFGNWVGSIGLGWMFGGLDWATIEGWRIAFVVVGLPGVLVALLLLMTVKEPPRGYSDPPGTINDRASFMDSFREIAGKPTFWWMAIGASLVAFVGYGIAGFQAPFLQRIHGIDVREAAVNYGAPLSAFAALGTFLGGWITERLSRRSETAIAWVPAVGLLLAVPAYIAAFFATNLTAVFVFWAIGAMCHYAYLGAQYNIASGVVTSRSRATAVAVLLILVSIIGNGIGPSFVGFFSDFFTNAHLETLASAEGLNVQLCKSLADLNPDQIGLCGTARAAGLRSAIALTACWFIVAAICFLVSARTLKQDFVAKVA
ncbi:MAG: MFS transporter, partial [Pseudomonadota bacterium]